MFRRRSIAAVLLICLMVLMCSCNGANVGGFFAQDETEDDYNVYIATERMRTLNPLISFDAEYLSISRLIYSGLFKLNSALVPELDLVESFSYSDDKNSIELKLRSDVSWHDGEKFTAEDVKFTIELIKKLSSYNQTPYAGYVSNIRSTTLSNDDDYTITINFGSDDARGVENLTFPIMPSHLYNQRTSVNELLSEGDDFNPVGTGMYKVEEYDANKRLVLAANENYYGEKALNNLVFEILPNEADGLNLTETGSVSLVFMEEYDRKTYVTNKNLTITDYPSNVTEVVAFNMNGVFTSNKYVRQAIAHLIDNQAILESVYYQNGYYTDSIMYPGYYGLENNGYIYEHSTEKAQSLLTKGGCFDRDDDGYLENKYMEDMELVLLVNADEQLKSAAAEMIKRSLEAQGMTVDIDYADAETYSYKLASGEFDLFIGTCTINERHDLRPLLHSRYGNVAGYANETVDELTTQMVSGLSNNEKINAVSRLKGILIDEIPYYPLFCKSYGVVSIPEFRGELLPTFNNPYVNSQAWYCERKIILEN